MSAPVGSLAAEAALLLDAFAARLAAARPAAAAGAEPGRADAGAGPAESGGAEAAADDVVDEAATDDGVDEAAADDGVDEAATDDVEAEEPGREQATGSDLPGPCRHCGHDPARPVVCTSCPVCALVAVLRGERPETTARLVDGVLAVVQSLRALLPATPVPADDVPGAEGAGRDPATRNAEVREPTAYRTAEATPRLERIDIR